eukprot:3076864-Heterocapsa_arctica.AAC.1
MGSAASRAEHPQELSLLDAKLGDREGPRRLPEASSPSCIPAGTAGSDYWDLFTAAGLAAGLAHGRPNVDCGLAALMCLPGMLIIFCRVGHRVDIADVLGDVPVCQRPNEDSSRFLPLHGCACDEGPVEVDNLPGEGGRRCSSSGVSTDVLKH